LEKYAIGKKFIDSALIYPVPDIYPEIMKKVVTVIDKRSK